MTVEWREIPGWEGLYVVSNDGRVRSLPRVLINKAGVSKPYPGLALKAWRTADGYHVVTLCRGTDHRRTIPVHTLVLSAFVGPRPPGMQACHNDDDKDNNTVANLRWDSPAANSADKVRNGIHHMSTRSACIRGHEFTPENTLVRGGTRHCRACRRAISAKNRAKRAAA